MKIISIEEAHLIVTGFKDGRGKSIDPGISEALTQFTRFTKALGFATVQSCEGHIDWGLPFPWIDFEIPHHKVNTSSRWKVWKILERNRRKQENLRHLKNEEKKTDQLSTMMARYLVRHQELSGGTPQTMLRIDRWHRFRFRLMPSHNWLSEGYKIAGDNKALDLLLQSQRKEFLSFASFCLEELSTETNLVGIPDEGCPGCMGRG